MDLLIKTILQKFHKKYPYILIDEIVDYLAIFGGLEDNIELKLFKDLEASIIDTITKLDIESIFPFFILDEPFRKLLITLARGDGRVNSIFNKISVGENFGGELVEELIDTDIIYVKQSREAPLRAYPKQLIKRELRGYTIGAKLYFTKPFYRFWFAFVEPNRNRYGEINIDEVLKSYKKYGYRLSSLLFEQLSLELLMQDCNLKDDKCECGSYWDRYSEFDIYCQCSSGNIVAECKYTNRPITKAELSKLESKIIQSSLIYSKIALFSKSGFSQELIKLKKENLLLYTIEDLSKLLT